MEPQLNPQEFVGRVRAGRLPLPPRVTELAAKQQPRLAEVNAFVDRLAELPMSEWLAIGRTIMETRSRTSGAGSWTVLNKTITDHKLDVAAWHVRDAVETSAFLASGGKRWSSNDRQAFAAAHGAAEDAALALLVRPHLAAHAFAALHGPFEAVISWR